MDHRTTELSLARRVLAHHPLEPVRMRLVSRSFNTVYRVWDRTGAQFALRLGRPGWSSVLDIASATAWTDATASHHPPRFRAGPWTAYGGASPRSR